MSGKQGDKPGKPADDSREARLKAALKANIARRKSQAKARASGKPEGDAG